MPLPLPFLHPPLRQRRAYGSGRELAVLHRVDNQAGAARDVTAGIDSGRRCHTRIRFGDDEPSFGRCHEALPFGRVRSIPDCLDDEIRLECPF